jgi:hypothetical protein
MKKILFNPFVFFVSLIAGLLAAAVFWESTKPLPEFRIDPVVTDEENFEALELETPTGQIYDRARHDEVISVLKWIIENKKKRDSDVLAPFDQVSNLLFLENVAWDDVSVNAGRGGQVRMYHFQGFCLYLYLETRHQENSDHRSAENLSNKGVVYVNGLPSIQIDGLNDPQERIRLFRKEVAESVRRVFEESQKQEKSEKTQK